MLVHKMQHEFESQCVCFRRQLEKQKKQESLKQREERMQRLEVEMQRRKEQLSTPLPPQRSVSVLHTLLVVFISSLLKCTLIVLSEKREKSKPTNSGGFRETAS